MSRTQQTAIALLAITLATLLLNVGIFSASWRADDTQILLHAHQFGLLSDLTDPAIWQQFSPANFTPLLITSFELDLVLFGLTPLLFYVHQFLALSAGAILLYVCLRLWCDHHVSLAGALVFVCGLPVMLVAEHLMTRHYAEGLVFALLALYGYVRYLRTGRVWVLGMSALTYLLATLCKEVYVPLPLLLLLLPESPWQARLRAAAPLLAITGLYTLWRTYMLSSVGGGYVAADSLLSLDFLIAVLVSFASFPRLLAGPLAAVLVLLPAVLMAVWWFFYRRIPWAAFAGLALVLLPLVPLVSSPGIFQADRYLFALWAMAVFLITLMIQQILVRIHPHSAWKGVLVFIAFPVIAVSSLVHAVPERAAAAAAGREFDRQGEFVWRHDSSVAFIPSQRVAAALWFVTGMRDFKAGIGAGKSPAVLVDDVYLNDAAIQQVYAWDAACECMTDISAQIPERLLSFTQRVRPDEPLQLSFSYLAGFFAWEFGPYTEGQYHVVSDEIGVIAAPSAGRLRVTLPVDSTFYLRYTAPAGWVTYSDLQRIVSNAPQTGWARE